jgi:SAM-dependent methyltransferase
MTAVDAGWRATGFELYEGAPAGAEAKTTMHRAALVTAHRVLGGAVATAPLRTARSRRGAPNATPTVRFRFSSDSSSSSSDSPSSDSGPEEPLDLGLASYDAPGVARGWKFQVWDAAIVLTVFLRSSAAAALFPVTPRRVLELGAGVGLPGLDAARRGCRVTLTDYEERQLGLLSHNARGFPDTVDVRRLDWEEPVERTLAGRYDLVTGTDVCYNQATVDLLKRLILDLRAPTTLIVGLDCTTRGPWLAALGTALRTCPEVRVDGRRLTLLRDDGDYETESDATDFRARWDANAELKSSCFWVLIVSRATLGE